MSYPNSTIISQSDRDLFGTAKYHKSLLINLLQQSDDQYNFYQFQLKKTKTLANGTAPIYLRITIDGSRVEFSTRR
ncbi:MAG: Arm DNA-binding domain-containing protein [Bacteroidota bacterium]|nr:Arm DNA-binding domain-containing protein [Bacteroidota bacterium]